MLSPDGVPLIVGHPGPMTSDAQVVADKAAQIIAARLAELDSPRWTPLPHQVPPTGDWYGWLLLAGRGAGKTDVCAEYVAQHVKGPPCLSGRTPHWIGIIAPTLGDAATSCVTGPSGIMAHDPSARMVTVQGGTVVRWPNGSEAKLFGAHTEDEVERLRSGGNRCVREGSLVRTERGQVPIEQVRPGDRVWTRNGLRTVIKVWDNGVRPVQRFDHGAGSTWLTPDHEVWTEQRGWQQAVLVQPTDTVLSWDDTATRSRTTGFGGTRAQRTRTTGTVTGGCCTDGCGPRRSDPSRKACTCITGTTTSGTTGCPTSCCSRPASTGPNTGRSAGTTGMPRADGRRSRPGSGATSRVSAAPSRSVAGQPQPWSGSAPQPAVTMRHEHGSSGCAACAVTRSSAPLATSPAPVRGGALRSTPTRSVARVYDLTVEHDHEFFADDLLVSNCLAWLEEIAAWRYMDAAWDQMRFGLRVGPRPRWIGSTTPKPRGLIKRFDQGEFRDTVVTRASMYDNPHLPQHIRDALEDAYKDTRLGSQELLGLMMDEDENALWAREMIDAARTDPADLPPMTRITVGVDPSGGAGEQGIIVGGKSRLWTPTEGGRMSAHGFVLDDRTCHLKPEGWGRRAVQAAVDWEADDITVEINYGRDMAVSTIRAAAEDMGVSIPINVVTASRGKRVRAEPVSALTQQGRWRFGGRFEPLEDQLCTWTPELDWSPDRLDAMVWDAVGLGVAHLRSSGTGSIGRAAAMTRVIG